MTGNNPTPGVDVFARLRTAAEEAGARVAEAMRAATAATVAAAERQEKVAAIEAKGAEFLALLDTLHTPPQPAGKIDGVTYEIGTFDRDLHIARERIEEAVMWAVKHVRQ